MYDSSGFQWDARSRPTLKYQSVPHSVSEVFEYVHERILDRRFSTAEDFITRVLGRCVRPTGSAISAASAGSSNAARARLIQAIEELATEPDKPFCGRITATHQWVPSDFKPGSSFGIRLHLLPASGGTRYAAPSHFAHEGVNRPREDFDSQTSSSPHNESEATEDLERPNAYIHFFSDGGQFYYTVNDMSEDAGEPVEHQLPHVDARYPSVVALATDVSSGSNAQRFPSWNDLRNIDHSATASRGNSTVQFIRWSTPRIVFDTSAPLPAQFMLPLILNGPAETSTNTNPSSF